MTRKTAAKKAGKAKPAKPKSVAVYTVVRKIPAESPLFTEPERIFATKTAAQAFADARNREMRTVTNPFDIDSPDGLVRGGEKTFIATVKKLQLPVPQKKKGESYIDWEQWWDHHYFDMTDAQREAIWDALDKYETYKVKPTTLED